MEQGIPKHVVKQHMCLSKEPIAFDTGGGSQDGDKTIMVTSDLGGASNSYMLDDCRVVSSMGKTVREQRLCHIWTPDGLPFYIDVTKVQIIFDESDTIRAHRLEHNLPVYREEVTFAKGLPAIAAPGAPATSSAAQGAADVAIDAELHDDVPECSPGVAVAEGDELAAASTTTLATTTTE